LATAQAPRFFIQNTAVLQQTMIDYRRGKDKQKCDFWDAVGRNYRVQWLVATYEVVMFCVSVTTHYNLFLNPFGFQILNEVIARGLHRWNIRSYVNFYILLLSNLE
jgi:hypothetical protein